MRYTYKGKDYPKDLNIKHQEVFTTLSKDPLDITRREFDHLFDIPTEEFCADEEQLILWELGKQWGKSAEQLESDTTVNHFIIRNTLITLLTSYSFSSFDVVLEVLRQSEDIIRFNLPDYNGFKYILPILSIVFEYEPKHLEQFLLEKGLTDYSKRIVAELLARMGCETETDNEAYNKKLHDELSGIFQLKTVYSKDMVDKKICGELDTNLSVMKDLGCADLNYIETDIYQLMFLPTYLIWDNADNPDFGEQ